MAKKSSAIQYSNEMQKVVDKLGLKEENVLYLNITKPHLDRILSGEKKVEFRELSDYYLKKVAFFNSKKEYIGDKPITHILFQNGMTNPPKRALVEMKQNIDKYEKVQNPEDPTTQFVLKEAEKEGFEINDEYLAFILGDVVFREFC